MRNMNQMFVVTASWINEILNKILAYIYWNRSLMKAFLTVRRALIFSFFDKPHLYLFRNKEITPFLSKEK